MWKKPNLPIEYQLAVIAKAFLEERLRAMSIILALQDHNLQTFFYNCITTRGYDPKYEPYINTQIGYGFTPLHMSVVNRQPEQVRMLLSQPQIAPNIAEGETNCTALHWAILVGFEDIAEILIASDKVDINAQDKKEDTPLHLVCNNIRAYLSREDFDSAKKSCELIKLLFKQGAKDDLSNQENETPSSMLSSLIRFAGNESQPQTLKEIGEELLRIVQERIKSETQLTP